MLSDSSAQRKLARLRTWGVASWSALGVIALVLVILLGLGSIRSVVIPFVLAVILAAVTEPVMAALERRGVSHLLATVISLLVALLLAIGSFYLVARGFIQQLPMIYQQLETGWVDLLAWARSLELDVVLIDHVRTSIESYLPKLGSGVIGVVSATFTGALALLMGTFFTAFFFFFMLRDNRVFPVWLARVSATNEGLVTDIFGVINESLRGYFRGMAVTALLTAPIFLIPWVLLSIPSTIPIFVLYFVLSFVPYVGAWVTGAVAVLIALGAGGPSAAMIIGLTFVISNGAIQSVVASWALGASLRIHPVLVMLATLIGGAVAGLIGMILAAPLVAAFSRSLGVLAEHRTSPASAVPE